MMSCSRDAHRPVSVPGDQGRDDKEGGLGYHYPHWVQLTMRR